MPKPKLPMRIYHTEQEVIMGSKDRDTGKYPGHTKWMWGHIVTVKPVRTEDRFAIMMDPEGRKAHYITHAMFSRLKGMCEHVYLPVVSDELVDAIVEEAERLTVDQLRRVVDAMQGHTAYYDLYE